MDKLLILYSEIGILIEKRLTIKQIEYTQAIKRKLVAAQLTKRALEIRNLRKQLQSFKEQCNQLIILQRETVIPATGK
jgi:hypothetical protein